MSNDSIEELNRQLTVAIHSQDEAAIVAASEKIANLVQAKQYAKKAEATAVVKANYRLQCAAMAEKYPCVCGGHLVILNGWDNIFDCEDCGQQYTRKPDEDARQRDLQNRIARFKQLIRKVAKIANLYVRFNKELTKINRKPFLVFSRNDYPLAIAYKYESRYRHESLASGAGDWSHDLLDVAEEVLLHIFHFEWEETEAILRKIRNLPREQLFPFKEWGGAKT